MSEREQSSKYMAALVSLVLLLFSAVADFSNGKPQDSAQRPAVCGLGAASQTNAAANIAAQAARPPGLAQATRNSGTKRSVIAILDGLRTDVHASYVSRSRKLDSAPHSVFAVARTTSVRAPPASLLAL